DGDGTRNNLDCAPFDPSVSTSPPLVGGISVSGKVASTLLWTDQGAGFRYDVASGYVSVMRSSGTSAAACLANDLASASATDSRPNPPPADGFYYLVRSQSTCGTGSYGTA